MACREFAKVVATIDGRGIMPKTPPSLDRTRQSLGRLNLRYPPDLRKVILVAGTNGKGTTSKTLATLLNATKSEGQKGRVGFYCSPHLVSPVERIQIDNAPISEELFCDLFYEIDDLTRDLKLTHFETLTAMMARLFFYRQPVEFAILEVGLGGLFDSTNAIPHQTCVITRLGLDHQDILGASLAEIALQKFGIIQPGARVYHHPWTPELLPTVQKFRESKDSERVEWSEAPPFEWQVEGSGEEPKYFLHSQWGRAQLALLGERAAENTNLALHVFEGLGFDAAKSLPFLKDVEWPGRMQRKNQPQLAAPLYLSGDHNLQGVQSLREILANFKYTRLYLLFGVGEKKDAEGMIQELQLLRDTEFIGVSSFFRARSPSELQALLPSGSQVFGEAREALAYVVERSKPTDLVVVTGSLYLVGEVLALS